MAVTERVPDCGFGLVCYMPLAACICGFCAFEWLSSVQLAVQRIIALLHTDSTDYERFLAASGSELHCKACPHC